MGNAAPPSSPASVAVAVAVIPVRVRQLFHRRAAEFRAGRSGEVVVVAFWVHTRDIVASLLTVDAADQLSLSA